MPSLQRVWAVKSPQYLYEIMLSEQHRLDLEKNKNAPRAIRGILVCAGLQSNNFDIV
jgi:hypothetical protein